MAEYGNLVIPVGNNSIQHGYINPTLVHLILWVGLRGDVSAICFVGRNGKGFEYGYDNLFIGMPVIC